MEKKFKVIEEGMTRDTMKKLVGGVCGKEYCTKHYCTHTTSPCATENSCSDYAFCPPNTGTKSTCSAPYVWCTGYTGLETNSVQSTSLSSLSLTNLAMI